MLLAQALQGLGPAASLGARELGDLTREGAQRTSQLHGTADTIALPEGHLARLTRRRRDQHAVVLDGLDAPSAGA